MSACREDSAHTLAVMFRHHIVCAYSLARKLIHLRKNYSDTRVDSEVYRARAIERPRRLKCPIQRPVRNWAPHIDYALIAWMFFLFFFAFRAKKCHLNGVAHCKHKRQCIEDTSRITDYMMYQPHRSSRRRLRFTDKQEHIHDASRYNVQPKCHKVFVSLVSYAHRISALTLSLLHYVIQIVVADQRRTTCASACAWKPLSNTTVCFIYFYLFSTRSATNSFFIFIAVVVLRLLADNAIIIK